MQVLLSPEFQARLEGLVIALRRSLPSTARGERRSAVKKGLSLEFADHRAYVPGDDVRHLDWASYARLDQLVLKLYHDEEDLQLNVLVDDSASMSFGSPTKASFARQAAAALAWIGLVNDHRVTLGLLRDEIDVVPAARGRGSMQRFLEALAEEQAPAAFSLHEAVRAFAARTRPRGAIVVLSDLLDRDGVVAALKTLEHPTRELHVVHVLAPEEVEPESFGDFRYVDSETGEKVEVSLTAAVVEGYQRTVRAFQADCAENCRRRNATYSFARSDASLEDFVLRTLVREGVLR